MKPFSDSCYWSWQRSRLECWNSISTCIILVVRCITKRELEELCGHKRMSCLSFVSFFSPLRIIKSHKQIQICLGKAGFHSIKWGKKVWKGKSIYIYIYITKLVSWNQVFFYVCFSLFGSTNALSANVLCLLHAFCSICYWIWHGLVNCLTHNICHKMFKW